MKTDFASIDIQKIYYRRSLTGSTLFAVDENGEVINHVIYDDWGKPLTDLPLNQNYAGIDNINNYAGYTYDEVLELYFVQYRFYNADTRQFTQEDPIKDGSNWYAYCKGNPLVWVDLWGLAGKRSDLPWDSISEFFHDLKNHAQGRSILVYWLYGEGKALSYVNDKSWSTYMTQNKLLTSQVQEIVKGYCQEVKCNQTVSVDKTISMEIENGEQMIGYQYLHGTNQDVGGFHIKGTIKKDKYGNAAIQLNYTWNDIIDPNFIYSTDSAKAKLAKSIPFANPTDYIIRISWDDTSVLSSKGKFTSGWLAGDAWVVHK